ncbi:phage holin [Virgibacillus necropolis]|uniref:Phage holin n=1 Tax=Virgibacillus necropolis TaxID=163877 RepID=A0A221MH21_9BACI|nr:phage holin [Virgibacillus necropolis]ASN06934.1 phage holin [Virgibacillus necropolis]
MNLKVRFKNPIFITQLILSIILPMLAYAGIAAEELTTWGKLINLLWDSISNPYVVAMVILSVWNALNDPTTKGLSDSLQAKTYTKPK